jgi:hypothetical protein
MATSDALELHRKSVGMKHTGSMSVVDAVLSLFPAVGKISSSPEARASPGKTGLKRKNSGMTVPSERDGSYVMAIGGLLTVGPT